MSQEDREFMFKPYPTPNEIWEDNIAEPSNFARMVLRATDNIFIGENWNIYNITITLLTFVLTSYTDCNS